MSAPTIEDIRCKVCNRVPGKIQEYVDGGSDENITPVDYVRYNEGTYNKACGHFYCTMCYIAVGMPLGRACGTDDY